MLDRRKKGLRFGENHPGATFTDQEVESIRRLHEVDGWTYERIAETMGCGKSTIAGICQYRRRGLRKLECA